MTGMTKNKNFAGFGPPCFGILLGKNEGLLWFSVLDLSRMISSGPGIMVAGIPPPVEEGKALVDRLGVAVVAKGEIVLEVHP